MFDCFSLELNSEVFNTNKRLKNLFHHRTLFHWKARGVGWYLRVGLCFLEAKNRIPPKKLTTSGTNRFDKDTYCKRKSTMNTLTFLLTSLFLMVYSMMIKSDQHQTTGKPLLTTFPLNRLRLEGSNHGYKGREETGGEWSGQGGSSTREPEHRLLRMTPTTQERQKTNKPQGTGHRQKDLCTRLSCTALDSAKYKHLNNYKRINLNGIDKLHHIPF